VKEGDEQAVEAKQKQTTEANVHVKEHKEETAAQGSGTGAPAAAMD